MPSPRAHRIAFIAVALSILLAGTAACAKKNGPAADGSGTGSFATGTPTPTADATTPAPATPTATLAPPPASYPTTAEDYSQAVIDAWLTNDTARLNQLTASGVPTELATANSWDKNYNLDNCQGAMGSQYCAYMNNDLDIITIKMGSALLGQAHAATDVTTDKMTYPANALSYAKKFLDEWQAGQLNRVAALSSGTIVSAHVDGVPAPTTWSPCIWGNGTVTHIRLNNTLSYMLEITVAKLGQKHAITAWLANDISC